VNDCTKELFLKDYFTAEALLGSLNDAERMFYCISDTYMIPRDVAAGLFAVAQSGNVREIDTVMRYHRYLRLMQFAVESGSPAYLSDDDRYMIEIKGGAIAAADRNKLLAPKNASRIVVYTQLEANANRGAVDAMRVLGILLCEGIFVDKNTNDGRALLQKTARWNNLGGILASLKYGEDRRANYDRLYTVAGGPCSALVDGAAEKYGLIDPPQKAEECALIECAVGLGKLDSEIYVPTIARLVYARIISVQDRRRILVSDNRELINDADDLPLKLEFGDIEFDERALDGMAVSRATERQKILQAVYNSDLRAGKSYREMCLCSDCEYIRDAYADALTEMFKHSAVTRIDCSAICDEDMMPTKNNIFVRSCDEDKSNVFLIFMHGEVRPSVAAAVKMFLTGDKRKSMRLTVPNVSIDLGAVLPVCICDKSNARSLRSLCDIIELKPVGADEKSAVIDGLLKDKAALYGLKSVKTDDGARAMLASADADEAARIIDRAIRDNRKKGKSLTLTEAHVKECCGGRAGATGKYGFGGTV